MDYAIDEDVPKSQEIFLKILQMKIDTYFLVANRGVGAEVLSNDLRFFFKAVKYTNTRTKQWFKKTNLLIGT